MMGMAEKSEYDMSNHMQLPRQSVVFGEELENININYNDHF